jgi:hypothetical protein
MNITQMQKNSEVESLNKRKKRSGSIYEIARMSGENRQKNVLKNYEDAESSDLCSDTTDQLYLASLMRLLQQEQDAARL